MRNDLLILPFICGFSFISVSIVAAAPAHPTAQGNNKAASQPQAAKPSETSIQKTAEQAEEDGNDIWYGPVPRTQRGSRFYQHGIGWSVSPDGYFATPAAPVYHHGTVTPGHAYDEKN